MYTYNITWNDKVNPKPYNQSCHIQADDMVSLGLKFNQLHPMGIVLGLKLND